MRGSLYTVCPEGATDAPTVRSCRRGYAALLHGGTDHALTTTIWLSSRIFETVSSNHCGYAWNTLVSITRRDAQWPIVSARRSREVPRKYAGFTRTAGNITPLVAHEVYGFQSCVTWLLDERLATGCIRIVLGAPDQSQASASAGLAGLRSSVGTCPKCARP